MDTPKVRAQKDDSKATNFTTIKTKSDAKTKSNILFTTVNLSPKQKLILTNGNTIILKDNENVFIVIKRLPHITPTGVVQAIEMNAREGVKYPNAKILKDNKNIIWIDAGGRKIKQGTFSRIANKLKTPQKVKATTRKTEKEALEAGYDYCAHCFGKEETKR